MDSIDLAKTVSKDIIAHRQRLHQIPELGLDLPQTTAYVREVLEGLGLAYSFYEDISSLTVVIEGGQPGPVLGLRADMDGLPVAENTGLAYASTNGCMHACGHDGHTAVLLGVAQALIGIRDQLKGSVKLFFQAGEEYPGGAKPMIERGALADPRPDHMLGLHQGTIHPHVPKGSIGLKKGALMASMDRFQITVLGRGGHGAYPQTTVDSINIAAEIVQSLNKIVAREVRATEPAVLSVTRIQGGFNQNILPDRVELEGTCRSTSEKVRQHLARRIGEVAQGIAGAYGAGIDYVYDFKYPATINDGDFTDFLAQCAAQVLGPDRVTWLQEPVMGGEDMAFFLQEIPGSYFFLSNAKKDPNPAPHHSPEFDLDEDLLYLGAAVLLEACRKYLA